MNAVCWADMKRIARAILLTLCATAASVAAQSVSTEDREAIQALTARYAQALGGCRAAEFADLFVPDTGSFASGFRGRMVGRKRLIELVESERQCVAPPAQGKAPAAPRPAPPVTISVAPGGARGLVSLGTAEYEDEYVKTAQGWRFASRTVIIAAEKAAGLDAAAILAIQRLGGARLTDYYEPDTNGVARLMTSGVRVGVANNQVTGRVFLKDGSYDDEIYEKTATGWSVKSSTHVAKK